MQALAAAQFCASLPVTGLAEPLASADRAAGTAAGEKHSSSGTQSQPASSATSGGTKVAGGGGGAGSPVAAPETPPRLPKEPPGVTRSAGLQIRASKFKGFNN